MSDFLDLALSLNPRLVQAYILGHYIDLSSSGLAGTVNGTPRWRAGSRGYALSCRAGGLNYGNTISMLDGGTILAFGMFDRLEPDSGRIVSKRNPSTDYEFFLNAIPRVNLYDGVNTSRLNYNYLGARSLSVRWTAGTHPAFFRDGAYVGDGDDPIAMTDSASDVRIGERDGGNSRLINPLEGILVYANIHLTDPQISDLHQLWIAGAHVGRAAPHKPYWFLEDAPEDADATMSENFPMAVDSDGEVKGTQGASVGTPSGATFAAPGIVDGASIERKGRVSGVITCSNAANIVDKDEGSIEAIAERRSAVAAVTYIVASNASLRTRLLASSNVSNRWYVQKGNPAVSIVSPDDACRDGVPAHLVLTWWLDGATRWCEFFLDGASMGAATYTDTSASTSLYLGNVSAAGTASFPGRLHLARTYSSRVTPSDARKLYLQYARKPTILAPRYRWPASLANVTSGPVGPWYHKAGTWQWTDDGVRRGLVCVAPGYVSTDDYPQAYGGWYARLTKGADANGTEWFFSASDMIGDGYLLALGADESVTLYESTTPALNVVISTAAGYITSGVEYEFYIARRCADSQFSLYIRGGAFADWALVGTGTDTVHTTAVGQIFDGEGGDRISSVILFPLGGTIDPTAGDLDKALEAAA